MKKILIIGDQGHYHLGLFQDIETMDNVVFACRFKKTFGFLLSLICKIYCARCINKFIRLPFRSYWYQFDKNIDMKSFDTIIVMNGALETLSYSYLKYLKKRGIKVFLYMIDSYDASSPVLLTVKDLVLKDFWNKVYSFDMDDVKKYGFTYMGFNYYSKHKEINNDAKNPIIDVYYTGGMKGGREHFTNEVCQFLYENRVKVQFDVFFYKGINQDVINGMNYITKWLPYQDVLQNVCNSRCILELMQKKQSGPSLRYFEAVVYNKKLLTNNQNIVNFPFYNPKWMKIIKTIEDIDIEWILKDEQIDYNYNNEFSPVHLVEKFLSE